MKIDSILTLNIQEFTNASPTSRKKFANDLGRAFEEIGFAIISNHNISAETQATAYKAVSDFFSLPLDVKKKYEVSGNVGIRGYTSFAKEYAKDATVGDLKEFFHVGNEVPLEHPLRKIYSPNVQVRDLPGFDEVLRSLYNNLLGLGQELLRALALYLALPENFFDERVQYGNSVLRPIHYPPLTGNEEPGALRSAAHEDINLITLLLGASSPGLQVLSRAGKWIELTTEPGQIAINVGDMLQRFTNYRLLSTTHRVVNPAFRPGQPSSTRYSIPFFLHPVPSMSLRALDSCVSSQNPARDPEILAGEFLNQRLRENKLL